MARQTARLFMIWFAVFKAEFSPPTLSPQNMLTFLSKFYL
ncbi:hypothetical protein CAMRE0001_0118 [Campylobacter rectus RM3267]|uniref:Uncharacterized protein n=1 Tax=Campylobacter rectus RM3267 TaxID=553218 RepID=B9CXQ6_CAMRE|nr:hypothetical protein CAMRE0001_0118 [Campylobacter rectus RM3267]